MTTQPHADPLTRAEHTLVRFFRHLDDSDYPALAALLDGVWHRQGQELRGTEAVIAALSGRSPTRRIHHILTNIAGTLEPDGSVALVAYMMVVQHDSGTVPDGPAPFTGFSNIRTLRAVAHATPEGWKLGWLKSDPASFAA